MSAVVAMSRVEIRLFLRDPYSAVVSILLPTGLMVAFGIIPGTSRPEAQYGGMRFIDFWAPSVVVITMAVLALQVLPTYVATYREKGVLRRLSTTPVHPAKLLAAQLLCQLAVAVFSILLLLVVSATAFNVTLPRHPLEFCLAFLLGIAAILTLGLLVGAVAPSGRAANGIALLLFFPTMFFGGVYVPRSILPAWIGDVGKYFPPGVQALQDSWTGPGVQWSQLGAMALITLVVGALAAKLFRWDA